MIQDKLPNIGDEGKTESIVAIDKDNNMVIEFNIQGKFRANMNN